MHKDENDKWVYDRGEFVAMKDGEQDRLMFWLVEQLNDFADYAREINKISEWMCKKI